MTDQSHIQILRRMMGQEDASADPPMTLARVLRRLLGKLLDDLLHLPTSVSLQAQDVTPLDDMLTACADDLMLIGLQRDGAVVGFVALDPQMIAALVEKRTIGHVLPVVADARPATRTDRMLVAPVIDGLLAQLPTALAGTLLDGWVDDVSAGDLIVNLRAAGLLLAEGNYRTVRLSVDPHIPDRIGILSITLPIAPVAVPADAPPVMDWHTAFQAAAAEAEVRLDAVLHRFVQPLAQVQALQVGQVLPLPGCTVGSVKLIADDGRQAATARLGQAGGMRAVRIEQPAQILMEEGLPTAALPPDDVLAEPLVIAD